MLERDDVGSVERQAGASGSGQIHVVENLIARVRL